MAEIFSYTLNGMEKWLAATNPARFQAAVSRRMRLATELNGRVMENAQRKVIQSSSGLAKNAALTVMIKGRSKPLIHKGELFSGIHSQVIDDYTVITGVTKNDSENYDIASIVAAGASIPVTPAMRGMFFYLWKASRGEFDPGELTGRAAELWAAAGGRGEWLPLNETTTHIVIPPRPWYEIAANSSFVMNAVRSNWHGAIKLAFSDMARQ